MTNGFQTITVEEAAEAYVPSRGKARYLFVECTTQAMRTLMPVWRNSELEEMLAAACIVHHVPVAVDVQTAGGAAMKLCS